MKDNSNDYSDEWQPYTGDYDKFEYDIRLTDGREVWNCYPNARKFNSMAGPYAGQTFDEDFVTEIRFSERPIMDLNFEVSKVQQSWMKDAWVPIPDTGIELLEEIKDTDHFAGLGKVCTNVLYDFKTEDNVLEKVIHRDGEWYYLEAITPGAELKLDSVTHVRLAEPPEDYVKPSPPKRVGGLGAILPFMALAQGVDDFQYQAPIRSPHTSKRGRGKVKAGASARIVHSGGTLIKNRSTGRNEPCPCGSGNKFKKCCINK